MRLLSVGTFALTILALVLPACGGPGQQVISFVQPNLFPEGLVYDARRARWLVSSLREGRIGAVNDDGVYTPFIADERIISSIGLHIDSARDRLIVCVSDPGVSVRTAPETQGRIAAVGVYALSDGTPLFYGDLARLARVNGGPPNRPNAANFANDATVDAAGNIYVTNSFSPVIYRITTEYEVSEFLRSERFAGEDFQLNGIDLFRGPAGEEVLIVANSTQGTLTRIPLGNPDAMNTVQLPDDAKVFAADGVTRITDRELVVIANSPVDDVPPTAYFLRSADFWQSAQIVRREVRDWQFPTTADVRGGQVYALSAKLNILFEGADGIPGGGSGERVPRYEIYSLDR